VGYAVPGLELILNLVWFAISAGLFCYFASHRVAGPRYRFAAGLLALMCVSCLLFPVVSMTDDLNSSPALPETSKLKQLLYPSQLALGLFAHLLIAELPKPIHTRLVFAEGRQKAQMESLSFDLNRRPPPVLVSL
jgi:hypothetical protein